MRGIPGHRGRLSPEQIRQAVRRPSNHVSGTSAVVIENTHNGAGGRAWPVDEVDAVVGICRELGLGAHLDGARLVNAAVAHGVAPARLSAGFDTVTLCLSKGLGCPVGAVLACSEGHIEKARRAKQLLGGAMRQSGIVAAAGVYALEHNVDRIVEDHARAVRLAVHLDDAGLHVDLEQVETNFVLVDVAAHGMTSTQALERLAASGVLLSASVHPGVLRAVVHLDITDADIAFAGDAIASALRNQAPHAAGWPAIAGHANTEM